MNNYNNYTIDWSDYERRKLNRCRKELNDLNKYSIMQNIPIGNNSIYILFKTLDLNKSIECIRWWDKIPIEFTLTLYRRPYYDISLLPKEICKNISTFVLEEYKIKLIVTLPSHYPYEPVKLSVKNNNDIKQFKCRKSFTAFYNIVKDCIECYNLTSADWIPSYTIKNYLLSFLATLNEEFSRENV